MLRKTVALGASLVATLVVAGCADQTTAPVTPAVRTSSVSVDARSTLLQNLRGMAVRDLNSTAGGRAINPGDYVCSSASPINAWLDASLNNTFSKGSDEVNRFFTLYGNAADILPAYEALVFQSSSTPQSYGYTGTFTKAIVKVEKDVKRFWDIPSADIQVVAMHGAMLLDVQRSTATYEAAFGLPDWFATALAQQNRDTLLASQTMKDPNTYPFWTFNAFSFAGDKDFPLPKKIVMGVGILEGYAAIGFGDVAPQAIFAHEFGHQLQFATPYDYPSTITSQPEATRHDELMADAFSAYFLTHARGASMNRKRVQQFLQVFFQIGDCQFGSDGHHGTPNQRMAAARFGFDVADQAQKQGHILTAAQFLALFQAKYPELVAPDAVAAK